MKSLKLADWANIAEIVASIVIVISLGYVGLEINQNTKALQNESHRSTLEMMNAGQNILATDEEFHRIYIEGLGSPTDLSDAEWSRFVQFMLPRIGAWEYLFLAKLEGSVSPGAWAAFDPYFREMICMPGLTKFIVDYESSYAPGFVEYVKSDPMRQCKD
jgi:hypothetical protein